MVEGIERKYIEKAMEFRKNQGICTLSQGIPHYNSKAGSIEA